MKSSFVVAAVILLIMVPAGFGHSQNYSISTGDYPSILVTNVENYTMNLSLYAVALSSPYLPFYFVNILSMDQWNVSKIGDSGVSYMSQITLTHAPGLPNFQLPEYFSTSRPMFSSNITMSVYVNITRYQGNVDSIVTYKSTEENSAYTYSNLSNHTLELTITMLESNDFRIPIEIYLFQLATTMSLKKEAIPFFNFNASLPYNKHRNWGGVAFSNNNSFSHTQGLYWWYNNYTINHINNSLSSSVLLFHGSPYIVFSYQDMNGSAFKIVQDPFLTVPAFSLSNLPIISEPLRNLYNYLVDNSAYAGAGAVASMVIIMATYISYRRRRL